MSATEAEVLAAIREIAASELQMTRTILPSHALTADLELDSLTFETLLASLENRFRVRLPALDSGAPRTVQELVEWVVRCGGERGR